jgi:hypothetical protein
MPSLSPGRTLAARCSSRRSTQPRHLHPADDRSLQSAPRPARRAPLRGAPRFFCAAAFRLRPWPQSVSRSHRAPQLHGQNGRRTCTSPRHPHPFPVRRPRHERSRSGITPVDGAVSLEEHEHVEIALPMVVAAGLGAVEDDPAKASTEMGAHRRKDALDRTPVFGAERRFRARVHARQCRANAPAVNSSSRRRMPQIVTIRPHFPYRFPCNEESVSTPECSSSVAGRRAAIHPGAPMSRAARWRSSTRRILPLTVLGSASRNSTARGYL